MSIISKLDFSNFRVLDTHKKLQAFEYYKWNDIYWRRVFVTENVIVTIAFLKRYSHVNKSR